MNEEVVASEPATPASPVSVGAAPPGRFRLVLAALFPWLSGLVLVWLFLYPLVTGAGLVGGDVYNYYFPLKHFYSQGLRANALWCWHPGIGHGIDVLSESQTGALYPFNLVAYRWLSLNTAYNAVQAGHYVLAFVFAYWLARSLRIGRWGSLLAALVYTYGWFPPRICLEWAIITGAWLPWSVLCTLRWLDEGERRWLWGLALGTCTQLLAGHFQLAFTTVVAIGVLTLVWPRAESWKRSWRARRAVPVAVLAGFLLAAPQLIPTWELKRRSDRADPAFVHTTGYGRIPLPYLCQTVAPFAVYADPESWLRAAGGDSNKTEAHLYFGLVPLALVATMLLRGHPRFLRRPWLVLALVGLVLAVGVATPLLARLPGFGYFRYPGRYGLMVQLAFALLAGAALGAERLRRWPGHLGCAVVVCFTTLDLWWVATNPAVHQVSIVRPPPAERIGASEVFRRLEPIDRVLAPDPNTLALSGASCVPEYLGMGPAEYSAIWSKLPNVFRGAEASAEGLDIIRRAGVTHLLTEKPIYLGFPATLLWAGYDPFLHPRWGRDPAEPLYLYRFDGAVGRAYLRRPDGTLAAEGSAKMTAYAPHEITIDCQSSEPCELVLADLWWRGWRVEVDGQAAAGRSDAAYPGRVVSLPAGRHVVRWHYLPVGLLQGCAVSVLTLVAGITWEFRRRAQTHASR